MQVMCSPRHTFQSVVACSMPHWMADVGSCSAAAGVLQLTDLTSAAAAVHQLAPAVRLGGAGDSHSSGLQDIPNSCQRSPSSGNHKAPHLQCLLAHREACTYCLQDTGSACTMFIAGPCIAMAPTELARRQLTEAVPPLYSQIWETSKKSRGSLQVRQR